MTRDYQLFLNLEVEEISLAKYCEMADAIRKFEETVCDFNKKSLRFENGCSELDLENEKFEQAKKAKNALTPVMYNQLDDDLLACYNSFEEKLSQHLAKLNLVSGLTQMVDSTKYLIEFGERIPTPAQIIQQKERIEQIECLMKELWENGEDITPMTKQRIDELKRNLNACLAPAQTNNFTGKGFYWFDDGSVYNGEWKDGKYNGKGIYRWADGTVYEGEWKDGLPNGKGKKREADGRVYEGEWKDGLPNGKEVMMKPNKIKVIGVWKNGKKIYTA